MLWVEKFLTTFIAFIPCFQIFLIKNNLWFETINLRRIIIIIKADNFLNKKVTKVFGFILSNYNNQYSVISPQLIFQKGVGNILVGSWKIRDLFII